MFSLHSGRRAKYSFAQALVGVLRIGMLPFLIALGAFGIYSAAGVTSLLVFIIGNLLVIKVLSSYRPAPLIRKRAVNDMLHYSFGNYIANILFYLPATVLLCSWLMSLALR